MKEFAEAIDKFVKENRKIQLEDKSLLVIPYITLLEIFKDEILRRNKTKAIEKYKIIEAITKL